MRRRMDARQVRNLCPLALSAKDVIKKQCRNTHRWSEENRFDGQILESIGLQCHWFSSVGFQFPGSLLKKNRIAKMIPRPRPRPALPHRLILCQAAVLLVRRSHPQAKGHRGNGPDSLRYKIHMVKIGEIARRRWQSIQICHWRDQD